MKIIISKIEKSNNKELNALGPPFVLVSSPFSPSDSLLSCHGVIIVANKFFKKIVSKM